MSIDSRAKSYGKIWGGWTMGKLLGTGSGGKTAVFQLTRDNLTFTEHCAMNFFDTETGENLGQVENIKEISIADTILTRID